MWKDLPYQPSGYRERPRTGGYEEEGWTSGLAGGHQESHVRSINIGPVGLWNSIPMLEVWLRSNPAVIMLQDTRIGQSARARMAIRKTLHWLAPLYTAQFSSSQQREWDEVKQKQVNRLVGVCTLVHKELQPVQEPVPMEGMGLTAKERKACEGRVLVTTTSGRTDKADVYVNVYQHVARRWQQQELVWKALRKLLNAMGGKVNLTVMAGDFNASLSPRRGYVTDMTTVDTNFRGFVEGAGLQQAINVSYHHTWEATMGEQASVLDYIFVRADRGVSYGCEAGNTGHPSHDHAAMCATFAGADLHAPVKYEVSQPEGRMNMKEWSEHRGEYQRRVAALIEADGDQTHLTPAARLARGMEHADHIARELTWQVQKRRQNRPMDNKELRLMIGEMGTLKASRKERLVQGKTLQPKDTFAQRRAEHIVLRDELTEVQWAQLKPEERYEALGAAVQRIGKEYRAELNRMKRETIQQIRDAKRKRMTKGGEGEIQRLLGKKAPHVPQWGLLPRTAEYRYPSVVQMLEGGREAIMRQHGAELQGSFTRWEREGGKEWWSFKKGETTILLRKRGGGEEVSFSPLTAMASFLMQEAEVVGGLVVDTDGIPWTTPSDKLSQLEYYYSRQSTAIGSRCKHCMQEEGKERLLEEEKEGRGLRITPVSKQEGELREVVWWCDECKHIREVCTEVQPSEHTILDQLGIKKFKAEHGLSGPLDMDSFRYYLDQLPTMKAAGSDAIPYELLRDAPDRLTKDLVRHHQWAVDRRPSSRGVERGGGEVACEKGAQLRAGKLEANNTAADKLQAIHRSGK